MTFAQPNLFGDDQQDLFGAPQPKREVFRVNPQHVINRFIEFEALMKAAAAWPWDEDHVETLKSRTWPYLYGKLRDVDCSAEADKWKAVMDAEAHRLDAAVESQAA
jgi:hypothetical protein